MLAQEATAKMGLDPTSIAFQVFDRYGVSVGMLVVFIIAGIYILRRLLHEDRGLLTNYVKSTTDQQAKLADTVECMARTDAKMAAVLDNMDTNIDKIEGLLTRSSATGSRHDNTALVVCYRHECDVLEAISDKLQVNERTKPLLDMMRRELDMAAQRASNELNEV